LAAVTDDRHLLATGAPPGRAVDYSGRMAGNYDAGRELSPDAEEAWARTVASHAGPGCVVVDVGAGTGRFARRFAERFDAEVIAVEPARGMRAEGIGATGSTSVRWIAGRAEALPVRAATADVVWLCCVVHYLDLAAAGSELARILRPGGTLLVRSVFPDRFDDLTWLRWFPTARAIDEERMPTVDGIVDAWRPCGLTLEARVQSDHRAADDLAGLADRLQHRAISTLELISDDEFEVGLAALRADAATTPVGPVYSPVDVLVFTSAA
jgi:ubiquinone/menaquinone biosynthesis C-methylase UbiE